MTVAASVIGLGQVRAGERWEDDLVDLAVDAVLAALADAGIERPGAIVVGNALGGALGEPASLASFVADRAGLAGIETHTVNADEASGAAALRVAGALLAAGGIANIVACGVEKVTDHLPERVERVSASALDPRTEAALGWTPHIVAAILMRSYLERHGIDRGFFGAFAEVAHANAITNPNAFARKPASHSAGRASAALPQPLGPLDCAPLCDGAAAVVLARSGARAPKGEVRIAGRAARSDSAAIASREDTLDLPAARSTTAQALSMAGRRLGDVALFELHDSSSILAALSLEACGVVPKGGGARFAAEGGIARGGPAPMSTMGGLRGRGHPLGGSGLYQVVEAAIQLRGEAGENQVRGARIALVQALGTSGATAITHVLERA